MKKMHIILPNSVKISLGILCILFGSGATVFASSYESTLGDSYVQKGSKYYEQGISGAQWYIDLQKNDDAWRGKTPKLDNHAALYYSDSEVAYIEYKIICGTEDCGSVTVNLDGLDVLVPEGATFGKANFENLQGNTKKKGKLYRFGLLEQYFLADDNTIVTTIKPSSQEQSLREINEYKEKIRDYRKNNQTTNAKAATPTLAITPLSTTATNVYIPGASTVNCPSRTPCYGQFSDIYGGTVCTLGCSPNAMAIIYGYYDRQGTKPNLVTGVATDISYVKNASGIVIHALDANIKTMSNSIRTSMGTQCYSGTGGTLQSNVQLGIAYAKSKGYNGSTSTHVSTSINPANILQAFRVEVNAGRPMIIHSNGTNSGHSFVGYGYSSDNTSTMVRVNYGGSYLGDKSYFGRDINLAQAVPTIVGGGTFNAYTKVIVSN